MPRFASLALLVAGVLFAAAAIEVCVRVFSPVSLDFYDWRKIKRASDRPGQSFEYIPGGRNDSYVGVPVAINALGLRDDEIATPKPPGTVRIVAIGDSVTFGYGVRLEETFEKVLEAELKAEAPNGVRYEVVNAGMEGTGLDSYERFLRTSAPAVEPDLVLVGIVLNDIADYRGRGAEPDAREFSERSAVRRVNTFLLFHSQSYLFGYLRLKAILYRFGVLDYNLEHWYDLHTLQPPTPEQEAAWSSSLEVLDRVVAAARARGYPLALVVFPMEMQLDSQSLDLYRRELRLRVTDAALGGAPQQVLLRYGERSRVPVLDLLPAFRAAAGEELYLRGRSMSADPVHPSARGHRVAADALFRFLRDEPAFAERIVTR